MIKRYASFRLVVLGLVALGLGATLQAQKQDPVQWTLSSDIAKAPPGSSVALRLTAKLEDGWHLYSLTQPKPGPDGGPNPSTAVLAENPAVDGSKIYQPSPERKFDPNFKLDTETFEKEAQFLLVAKLKKDAPAAPADLTAQVRYQVCNDTTCLPPRKKTASFTLAVDTSATASPAFVAPAGYKEVNPEGSTAAS